MTEKEYNNCVQEHADGLFRFILKNTKHIDDAHDIIQTSYEKMWNNRTSIDAPTAKSYLFTIAYNCLMDYFRKAKNISTQAISEEHAFSYYPQPHDVSATLHHALLQLPEMQRMLVLLKDYEGYTYHEISKITGLTALQVKVYLHRARLKLKNYLVSIDKLI
jgi:RNA polymerase sigma-70 factor (ECF subfamily)